MGSKIMGPSKKTSLPNSFPVMEDARDDDTLERKTSLPAKPHSAAKSSTIIEDSKSYKIILDFFGYKESEISVTILNNNAVLIEGKNEIHIDGKILKKCLRKPYQIPSCVDLYNGACYLSAEGTLNLTMPKKGCTSNLKENVAARYYSLGTPITIQDKSKKKAASKKTK